MAIPPPQLLDAAAAVPAAVLFTVRDAIAFGIGIIAGIVFTVLVFRWATREDDLHRRHRGR